MTAAHCETVLTVLIIAHARIFVKAFSSFFVFLFGLLLCEVTEARELLAEVKIDAANRAIAVLRDADLRDILVLRLLLVVVLAVEEHDDIEYAEKMQYGEAVFIEDSDTVTIHDIESGYTKRLPVSDVLYNDPKPDSHKGITSRDTLNILADAISDVGSWWCWHVGDDMLQLEFCDVQLYDETKAEKETHTTDVLAVRFYGHVFAVFLDDLSDKNWHERFRDDDSVLYPVDTYDMAFDDNKEAESLLNDYRNRVPIKDFKGAETLVSAKHILCARCDEVGFIVGGDEIEIAGKKGKYKEEEIEPLSRKWWEYWKDYWRLRGTRDALPKDYACEVTIPVDKENPQGNW